MLIVLWSHSCILFSASTSQINDEILDGRENATAVSQDQQVSSQYYRPYYYNRRPAYNYYNQRPAYNYYQRPSYPSRPNYRPAYVNNQRPAYSSVPNNNYRPTTTTTTTRRPSISNNNYCTSSTPTDSNQGNWICWDQTNQKLRMGPNLTVEKLVIFYAQLCDGRVMDYNEAFRQQICEQSRRFNNVGIVCVKYDSNAGEGHSDCPSSRKFPGICTAVSGMCVCVNDQFQDIASQNMSPGMLSEISFFSSSFDIFSTDPFFSG